MINRFIRNFLNGQHIICKRPVLEQLHANVLNLVTDQYGSFVIEHVIEHGLPEDWERIVRCLHENVPTLVTDQYGSYVIEHVIEHGRLEDRERIVRCLHENVTSLSVHKYGSRVIRSVLEHCTEQQKRSVLEQLRDIVPTLVTDKYGNYVIQHVIVHGLPEDWERIVRCLHENVPTLVTDQYGSYVIEHVIEHGRLEDRERIVRTLQGDILKTHYKSICSIIEKCLTFGTTEQKNALIDQLCADDGTGKTPLLQMMKQQFANDVVVRMVDGADSAHRDKMMFAIEEHIPALLKRQQSLKEKDGRRSRRQKEEAE
uniref:PUM-HD domain-containing protein n=1 Tax=Globodera rostochiensis TaxID=31243 RepID=A0A914IEA8_GLORO